MDAFTVLVVITLVLISLCCSVYLEKQLVSWITHLIRTVKSELDD